MQTKFIHDARAYAFVFFLIILGISGTLWAKARPKVPEKIAPRIGVCLPLTGNESVGQVQRQALLIAQRIRPTVGDKPVELVIKDTLGTAGGARAAMRDLLVNQDIAGFIGGTTTDEASAMIDVLSQNPRMRRNPVPVAITTAGAPLPDTTLKLWRISTPLSEKARAAAQFAVNTLKMKRAGILIDPADAEGVRLASLFSSALIAQGGVVAEIAYISKAEADYGPALASLARKKAEVIFLPASRTAPPLIVYSRSHGVKSPFLLADIVQEGGFIKAVGAAKDVYLVTDFYPSAATGVYAKRFLESYRKEYGEPDTLAALAADAYFLVCDTLESMPAGKGKHYLQTLMAAFKDKGYLSGKIDIAKNGTIVRNTYVCVIHASRLKCLETLTP